MNRPLMRSFWLCLRRDWLALMLIFLLPIVFFSIMTAVLEQISDPTSIATVKLGVIDYDDSDTTRYIIRQLKAQKDFSVAALSGAPPGKTEDQTERARLLRDNHLTAIVVFPVDFEKSQSSNGGLGQAIELLEDRANPIYAGILAKMLESGLRGFAQMAIWSAVLPRSSGVEEGRSGAPAVRIERLDVFGAGFGQERKIAVAYGAAGNAVLFLLFAMAGSGATLLDEEESGVVERILVSGVSVREWLLHKWVFFTLIGVVQVTTMFLWGALVYHVELFKGTHFWGFLTMTLATALAAAALGILMAILCRSRRQLVGISTVVIVVMSALGGSMFPRFLMSSQLKIAGLFTFNAWALDGYQKVFWYEASLFSLAPQVAVLVGLALTFMTAAVLVGRRRAMN
jgi:ABC-2 type transport system permease protein